MCITAASLFMACCTTKQHETMSSIKEKNILATIDSILAKSPQADTSLLKRGIRNAASFWKSADGTEKAFQTFCINHFMATPEEKATLFNTVQKNLEIINGHYNRISMELKEPVQLAGPTYTSIDEAFGALDPYAHFADDMGSVLTGENAAVPSPYDFALGGAGDPSNPIGANGSVLKEGNSVMIDMCGNFTGYLDDITRTFSIGTLPEKAYKAHQTAIEIQDRIQENLKEGALCEDIYKLALTIAAGNGLADCFMGTLQQAKFVGHGVGLVINEPPVLAKRSKEVLLPNMAIAVEPKFVIDGIGAVGLEDTYLVGKTGGEKITLVEPGIIDLLKGY